MLVRLFSSGIELETLRRALREVTVACLCLPLLVFVVGWLRTPLAACFVVAVGAVLVALGRRQPGLPVGEGEAARLSLVSLAVGIVPVAALVAVSGAGGFGVGNWDWVKHNAVLTDLIVQPWPVRYATEAGTTGLVYYVAYHLPAAVVGKLAGWTAANLAIAATSLIGAALAVLWLVVLVRGSPVLCGLLFVLFSGMDVLGAVLTTAPSPDLSRIFSEYHLENWSGLWQYSSNVSLLYFVPHQAIGAWLLTALLVDAAETRRDGLPLVALVAVGLLWSPFVTVGLLPLLVASRLTRKGSVGVTLRAQRSLANLAGVLLAALLAAYFASRFLPLALPPRFHPAQTPVTRGDFWLVPLGIDVDVFAVRYGLFVICEFAVLWLIVLRATRRDPRTEHLVPFLWASGLTLFALPFFHHGLYNDLVMRSSIPALFVLQISALHVLRHARRRVSSAVIAVVLAVGALYSGNLLRMHMRSVARSRHVARLAPRPSVGSLFHMQLHDPAAMKKEFVVQYLGSTDSLFFRYLARPSAPATIGVTDPLGPRAPQR